MKTIQNFLLETLVYGFNFRPTEMTGVIGVTQLKKINKILRKNKKNY